jgi:hypothetical protein
MKALPQKQRRSIYANIRMYECCRRTLALSWCAQPRARRLATTVARGPRKPVPTRRSSHARSHEESLTDLQHEKDLKAMDSLGDALGGAVQRGDAVEAA